MSSTIQLKNLIGAVIFAFAGALSAADYSAPAKPAKAVETSGIGAARLAIDKWEYEKAIALLKTEAAKDPNNADVQNLLGYSRSSPKKRSPLHSTNPPDRFAIRDCVQLG